MGNICRSPMAEGIMTDIIKQKKLNIIVDSAGTINYHQGEPPDKRAQNKSKQHGIDISHLRARPFVYNDFINFDHIFVMDTDNFNDIIARAKTPSDKKKVKLIMNEVFPEQNIEVPDPYYGGDIGFENVFQMLSNSCNIIAEKYK